MKIIFQIHENDSIRNLWEFEPLRVNIHLLKTSCALEIITTPEQEEAISSFTEYLCTNHLCFKENVDIVLVPDTNAEITVFNYIFFFLPINPTTTICLTTLPKAIAAGKVTPETTFPKDALEYFSKFEEETTP